MQQVNYVNTDMAYEKALSVMVQLGYDKSQANPTSSFLRTEQAIATNANVYTFPIRTQDKGSTTFVTQKLLNQTDAFIMTSLGIFVTVGTDATSYALNLYTYANVTAFSTSLAAGALMALWNGSLSITINNIQVLPQWDLWRHYKVPRTQQQSYVAYSTATAIPLSDSFDFAEDGFFPVPDGIVLNGQANTVWNITLPGAITTIQAASRIVCIIRGTLLQNVTTAK